MFTYIGPLLQTIGPLLQSMGLFCVGLPDDNSFWVAQKGKASRVALLRRIRDGRAAAFFCIVMHCHLVTISDKHSIIGFHISDKSLSTATRKPSPRAPPR